MPNIETIQSVVTIIKDIFTCLATLTAAVTGAVVAILGFRTWKKQLHWKTQYDLAQRILQSTYKVRQALAFVRDWIINDSEASQAKKEANLEDDSPEESKFVARGLEAVYRKRWEKAEEALVQLDTLALEAEAIWGQVARKNIEPLSHCILILKTTIRGHLQDIENPPTDNDKEYLNKKRQILYDFGEKDNFFSNEITAAVRKIETFLKPYLKT